MEMPGENIRLYRLLVENTTDILTVLDGTGLILYESPSIQRALGWPPEELLGKNAFSFIHEEDRERVLAYFFERLKIPGVASLEFRFRHKDGSWHYLEAIGNNLLNDPEVNGIVVTSRDITRRVLSEQALKQINEEYSALNQIVSQQNEELRRLATHDYLTGLMNRDAVITIAKMEFERWVRHHRPFSILLFDIDNLKSINDRYGYLTGDAVLKQTAQTLVSSIRKVDFPGRYGGEEFLIVLPETRIDFAMLTGERILENLRNASYAEESVLKIQVTASGGAAEASAEDDNIDSLFRRADVALYKSKERGKNQIVASSGTDQVAD